MRPGLKTLWGLKKTFQEFQLSSTYVLTPSSRKINLIINSTHLSRLISANCTFHICDHNRSFSQTKNAVFTKFYFSIDPYFTHYAALVKNSKQRLICCRVTTARATSGGRRKDRNTSGQRGNKFNTSYRDISVIVAENNSVVKPKYQQYTSLNKMLSNFSKVLMAHISFTAVINNRGIGKGIGGIRKGTKKNYIYVL